MNFPVNLLEENVLSHSVISKVTPIFPVNKGDDSIRIDFQRYRISPTLGFLLDKPLTELPYIYEPWGQLAESAANLIETGEIRSQINQLPLLRIRPDDIGNRRLLYLAHLQLSTLASAYVWCRGEVEAPLQLPRALAVPLWEVSQRVGLQPILSHPAVVLHNWELIDQARPFSLDNLSMLYAKFIREMDMDYFFLVTAQVEATFAKALGPIQAALTATQNGQTATLSQQLDLIADIIRQMSGDLAKMYDYVRPDVFYWKVRPFLTGYTSASYKAHGGIVFQGVSTVPLQLSGGSAAQSSVLHTLDAFLGIQHGSESLPFLTEMRQYMPTEHAAFLDWLERASHVRATALGESSSPDLVTSYNSCIEALTAFRNAHVQLVTSYILNPKNKQSSLTGVLPSRYLENHGTGGTKAMPFLKSVRNDCKQHVISSKEEN